MRIQNLKGFVGMGKRACLSTGRVWGWLGSHREVNCIEVQIHGLHREMSADFENGAVVSWLFATNPTKHSSFAAL